MTPTSPQSAPLLQRGEHWLVFNKPAGMTVVSGRGVPRPTLLDLAVELVPAAKPVHRLDKPTTGCCVIATSTFGQQALSDAFRRHIIDKRYVAIVEGTPTWTNLAVDARLARVDDPDVKIAGRKAPLAIQTVADDGVRALTRLRVLARGQGFSLIEARPALRRQRCISARARRCPARVRHLVSAARGRSCLRDSDGSGGMVDLCRGAPPRPRRPRRGEARVHGKGRVVGADEAGQGAAAAAGSSADVGEEVGEEARAHGRQSYAVGVAIRPEARAASIDERGSRRSIRAITSRRSTRSLM